MSQYHNLEVNGHQLDSRLQQVLTNEDNISQEQQAIAAILLLIPSAASELNKLADKSFVNSSIAASTATFRGTYNLVEDLELTVDATHEDIATALLEAASTSDCNDYAFVQIPTSDETPTEIRVTERYKFDGEAWQYEYDLNNSGFTSDQWEAINSGITSLLTLKLAALPTMEQLQAALNAKQDQLTFDDVPTEKSQNPVKSGGIKAAIDTAVTKEQERAMAAESALENEIDNVNRQDVVPVDTLPSVATADPRKIYRVVGSTSYTDYMVNAAGDGWKKLAEYTFPGVDNVPTAGSNDLAKSGGIAEELALGAVFDVTAHNSNATFASLNALLSDANLNTLIPTSVRKGGMSIKFVQTSDNNYVQFRCMAQNFTTDVTQWQGVDEEPTVYSNNVIESGGVFNALNNKNASKVLLTDYLSAKYIDGSGNIQPLGSGQRVYYIPCQNEDIFELFYKYAFSSGSIRSYAIYSVESVENASSSNVLEVGKLLTSYTANVAETINVKYPTAKLLCISYSEGNMPQLDKITYTNKSDENAKEIESLNDRTLYESFNLYDSSKQTSETISPHYFVSGEPYSSTQFDNQWNCTDFIPVKGNVQYSIGLVPKYGNYVKPWGESSQGLFFYDSSKHYLSQTTDTTFTTPNNAKFIRFNYNIGSGVSLNLLNARCMLVYGDTLPSDYVAFLEKTIKEKISEIEAAMLFAPIGYKFESDALEVCYKHNGTILYVKLNKHGGNNLFDFKEISKLQSLDLNSQKTVILNFTTDWHAPFIMAAVNNIDGDNIDAETGLYNKYFTGGNHTYNNTGSGASATARTANLKVYADGVLLQDNNTGFASNVKVEWENYVQAYNTTKANGTGREVLKEIHTIVFNGEEFKTHVELVPLEEVLITTWYGFQYSGLNSFNKTVYIGGSNRAENTAESSTAGNYNPTGIESFGNSGKIRFVIDSSYDMGDRRMFAAASTQGAFVSNSKAYMWIIFNKTLNELNHYFVRGCYVFDMV